MLSKSTGVNPELAVQGIAGAALAGLLALMLAIPAQASQDRAPANLAGEQSQQWLVEAFGDEVFGVAYSGYREGQHPDRGDGGVYPSRDEILEDLDILIDYDLRLIRLYDAGPYSRQVLELIRERRLPFRVILGIWLKAEISNHEGCPWLLEPIPDEELAANAIANEQEVQTGIALAREFADVIVAVNVGNEALVEWNDHMMSVERVIAFVRQVKAGIRQPVTVAENFDWWRKSGAALGREVDFLGVHSYPMMDGDGRPVEDALAFTIENIEAVRAAIPDKPVAVLEAGWATTSGRFPERASEVSQKRYLNELRAWSLATSTPVLFFEAFDEPWKGDENDHLETEKHWGLLFENRSPKLALQGYDARQYREDAVVWAVNFGGEGYEDPVGVMFEADPLGPGATLRGIVDGTQKTDVFDSFRSGPQDIVRQLPDGEYDLTFLFTEPDGLAVGERVFDVLVQGRTVLDDLDVKRARWGPSAIALHRTVPGIVVGGGELRVQLRGQVGEPVISGLIVRSRLPQEQPWELIWSDEFDYSGRPDTSRWTAERWEPGRVNNERQAYTDSLDNARVEGGRLVIEARRTADAAVPYTSARLHSRGALDMRYGRVDIRARLPAGQGTWAALWMLPSDPHRYATSCAQDEDWQGAGAACDAWPNSGEIDIMEYVGFDPGTVHGSVHTAEGFGGQGVTASVEVETVEEEFHIYSLVWAEDRLAVLIDGVPFFSYLNAGEGWRTWPFDHAFHLVFNVAVGGSWGEAGGPVDDSIFPARLEIDYVRVYGSGDQLADRIDGTHLEVGQSP